MPGWYFLNSGIEEAAMNMALDEALLEAMPRLSAPVLRFYGWREKAASFGYFQKYANVAALSLLRPLVRRPTAGGLVPHDADWTYSLTFPAAHEWYALTARESYRRVHQWIQAALALRGLSSDVAAERRIAGEGQCFSGHEQFDLLRHGRKIAGAAQRRRREGLLIQGSLQPPPPGLERSDWEGAMLEAQRRESGCEWVEWKTDRALEERARELARLKYSQQSYNERR